ncbi:MAG: STAS domain-containing protein, partial [Planctomycetota bacterium]
MQIRTLRNQNNLILELDGRLDADWSAHVEAAIEAAVQGGDHAIGIDLQQVHYISSAGIGVLIRYHKKLTAVRGRLRLLNPGGEVLSVLKLMKLTWLMDGDQPMSVAGRLPDVPQVSDCGGCQMEVHRVEAHEPLTCRLIGHPENFRTNSLHGNDVHAIRFENNSFGLGLGQFGSGSSEENSSSGDFAGESLGVAGAVIQHATDGSRIPDFQLSAEELVPELEMLYGLHGSGDFTHLI